MELKYLVRKNIWNLKPYSSARDEFKGEASVYLDANENPLNPPYNRYPDPKQWELKVKLSKIKGIEPEKMFFGNGSDEAIDLAIRIFCEPDIDNVVSFDPTYGMYKVCSNINNIEYRTVLLNDNYQLDADRLLKVTDSNTKLVFLCSPNNPTGNLLDRNEIIKILEIFKGMVIVDEAYIDFAPAGTKSWIAELDNYPNLIVLQTFSKAWGMAAVRLGMAFASREVISFFNKVKYPYNINIFAQDFVLKELDKYQQVNKWVDTLNEQREVLSDGLSRLSFVDTIYPSHANFILVRVTDANKTYNELVEKGIIVRNRNTVALCNGCLRITVGTGDENAILLKALSEIRF